ncbi:hypothetical protein AGMMS49949_08310 [Alphaproteobacteria bacterium]|nr:hypothetical protein AGMMS49949_08310 [Alphaproteobacteria bacterium]GHS99383.1 hypothetical protein AGMMS50296_7530 [Alphaproteobacteria bacterium]
MRIHRTLQKFFKEISYETVPLWCDVLDAVERTDSLENCETLGADGCLQITNQANTSQSVLVAVGVETPKMENAAEKLRQTVETQILEKQTQALDDLQTQAFIGLEEAKVGTFSKINQETELSLFSTLQKQNKIQKNSLPMLFAVLSRENDFYGLGTNGVVETTGTNPRR